jgi:hypothetical protein
MDCGTMYSTFLSGELMAGTVTFFVLLLLILNILNNGIKHINAAKVTIFFVIYLIYASIILLHSERSQVSFVGKFMIAIPLLSMYFAIITPIDKVRFSLLYKFLEIMIYLSIISVILWIGGSCLGKIQPTGYVPYTWGENVRDHTMIASHYYYIYFETQYVDILGFGLNTQIRNTGIFAEGPMFNVCLCVALMIELYLKRSIKKWQIIILVVTMITTFSTTGFIFLPLIFISFIAYKKLKLSIRNIIMGFIYLVPIIFAGYFVREVIYTQKQETSSYQSRSVHITNKINTWLSEPVLGVGYTSSTNDTFGNSTGIFAILADGGIYFFSMYIVSFLIIPYLYYRKHKDIRLLIIFVLILFLLFPTIVHYRFIILMFIALAFSFSFQRKSNLIIA